MRPTISFLLLLAAVIAAAPRTATAQSLADVARQEGERRKALQSDGKTLTNADLGPATPSGPAPATPADDAAKTDAKGDKDKASDAKKDGEDKPKDEKYWSERMKALNGRLAEDKILADAMQTRVNALTTDFVNRDDPAQRAVIAADKQKALDELARLKTSVVNDAKAIGDAEEEARKAGVPPGWLR